MASTSSGKHPLSVDVESLLECSVCLERFTNPRVLPCQHTFCQSCLEQHVRTTFNNIFRTFYCPECRKRHGIPRGGVDQFPTNFLMNKLGDIHDGISNPPRDEEPDPNCPDADAKCANSTAENEHGKAVAHCKECSESFCKECSDWHLKFKATRDHTMGKLEKKVAEPITCPTHSGRDLSKFCERCSVAVCELCPEVLGEHHLHPCVDIAAAAASYKSELHGCVESITRHLQQLQDLPREMTETENKIKVDVFSARQNISTTVDALCRLVREQGQRMGQQVSTIEQEAMAKATDVRSQQLSQLLHFQALQASADRLSELDGVRFVTEVNKLKAEIKDLLKTPLQKMQWQANITQKELNGLKETMGKIHKEQASSVSDFKPDPTPTPSTSASDTTILPATKNLKLHQIIPVEVARLGITGIAVALNHIFLTHEGNRNLWVYTKGGTFLRNLGVRGCVECSGLAAMNAKEGRLVVSDDCGKHLHWVLVSETPEVRIVEQSCTPVMGIYYGLTADRNNYVVLTTRQPYNLWVYEPDVTSYAPFSFAGAIRMDQVREPTCAVRTSVGFAAFSQRHQEVVFIDDYGRRDSECRLWLPEHNANAIAGDMCLGYTPNPVVFMADANHDYIHVVGLEGGRHVPCALTREAHGIFCPQRVTWDHESQSLIVAQQKACGGMGYEMRVFTFKGEEPEPVQKEETTAVVMNVELPKLV